MLSPPKISIVTPSFNQGAFLEQTIKSILSQNYPNLQYIIIDGASRDNSLEIIEKHQAGLHYWVSETDAGHADALNKGFAQADGDILAWLNSDDMYTPWSLSIVAQVFDQHPDIDWIVGCDSWWDPSGRQVSVAPSYKSAYDFLLGNYAWLQQESVFFRRSLFEKAGGYIDTSYRLMVDGELWCRFFRHAKLWHVGAVLSGYRVHGSNRAREQAETVGLEMNKAIDAMKQAVPRELLDSASRLRRAKRLLRWLEATRVPVDYRRLLSLMYRGDIAAAAYPMLRYDHPSETWRKASQPYQLAA